jgi:23S rRNA (cytosine1962-C5)-methyltransferase
LRKGRERRVLEGHPWVFSGAVAHHAEVEPGSVVDVCDAGGDFVGRGYYNLASSIPVRVLTRDEETVIDGRFLRDRIASALALREAWIDGRVTNAYRIVHGESDGLPGLIVDRYADFLVVQFHTLGMDRFREEVVTALVELLSPTGIYERSDVGTRRAEGMVEFPTGLIGGEEPPELVEILENGCGFLVDLRRGQKTGFFLDQRENRLGLESFARGRDVLNCFSYSGGFSVYAARGNASRVTSVDVSETAIDLARQNLELNGFSSDDHPCLADNVFDYLKACRSDDVSYDVVIVDPPAFVKSQAALPQATRAYISLNRRAIQILRPGGILVTASCSTQIDYEAFFSIIKHAATAAYRTVQVIRSHTQAVDHPSPVSFPEGRYLKCFFAIVQ